MSTTDDKRYRECMAEIHAALQKYDMAGAITLVSKERAMFRYHFPTWSCISMTSDEVRFRAKRADYPSAEAHHETLELSAHIIMQMRDIAAKTFAMCDQLAKQLEKTHELEHRPFQDFDPERDN